MYITAFGAQQVRRGNQRQHLNKILSPVFPYQTWTEGPDTLNFVKPNTDWPAQMLWWKFQLKNFYSPNLLSVIVLVKVLKLLTAFCMLSKIYGALKMKGISFPALQSLSWHFTKKLQIFITIRSKFLRWL